MSGPAIAWAESPTDRQKQNVPQSAPLARHFRNLPLDAGEVCVFLDKPLSWMSLEKDTPERRSVQPPVSGRVVAVSQIAGLHHLYECRAADTAQL